MDGPDMEAYFRRIGYEGGREATLETLDALLARPICAIAFENVSVLLGHSRPLDVASVERKLVHNRRGGGRTRRPLGDPPPRKRTRPHLTPVLIGADRTDASECTGEPMPVTDHEIANGWRSTNSGSTCPPRGRRAPNLSWD